MSSITSQIRLIEGRAKMQMSDRDVQNLRMEMEPLAAFVPIESAGCVSIAIGMKRIADFICGTPDPGGKMDVVAYLGKELTGDGK